MWKRVKYKKNTCATQPKVDGGGGRVCIDMCQLQTSTRYLTTAANKATYHRHRRHNQKQHHSSQHPCLPD